MYGTEPRTLSNRELMLACDNAWSANGLPLALQHELLERFLKLAPVDEYRTISPEQLTLPL
ncbi:MAG: hypothetical protein ACKO0Z_15560 [Betaproteobacteria bacterium]